MRRNDEVAAQRRRWTCYETINFYIILSRLSLSIFFAVEKNLLDRTFFHIMEANLFLENDRKFFRLPPVGVSAPKILIGKEKAAELTRLPEKTAEDISKEF